METKGLLDQMGIHNSYDVSKETINDGIESLKDKVMEELNIPNKEEALEFLKGYSRGVRRGTKMPDGSPIPKRPFNNKKNSCRRKKKHSRKNTQLKKEIYGQLLKT